MPWRGSGRPDSWSDSMARERRDHDGLLAAFTVLDRAETLPSLESFLELGRELHLARLDAFITEVVTSGDMGRSYVSGLLAGASRFHDERLDAETRARVDDEGHVRKLLTDIEKGGWWLHVRDAIWKLARLAIAERDA